MTAMTTTSTLSTRPPHNGPRPSFGLAVQIVTLLDFTGPMRVDRIARALYAREDVVRDTLLRLMRTRHVSFSQSLFSCYETTGLWDPDRDGEESFGEPVGPPGPKRHHGDDTAFLPGLETQ